MKFEEWEVAFIQLTFPTETNRTIADYLNRKSDSIRKAIHRKIKTKRIDKIKIGNKFGKLEVVEFLKIKPKRGKLWKCLCECGKYKNVISTHLITKHVSSCGCLLLVRNAINPNGLVSGIFYGAIERRAKDRGLEFTVTLEFLEELLIKQNSCCALSNIPIYINTKTIDYKQEKSTASLDRINSKIGYTPENVQWVHADINYMKLDFDQKYFIKMCQLIAKHNINIDTTEIETDKSLKWKDRYVQTSNSCTK